MDEEEEEEEKESYRAARIQQQQQQQAASSSSSSSTPRAIPYTCKAYKSCALEHLSSRLDTENDRNTLAQITAGSFFDLHYCREHKVIGEASPLGDAKNGYLSCNVCPRNKNAIVDGSVIPLQLPPHSGGGKGRSPSDLEVLRIEWTAASKAVVNERVVRAAQRVRSTFDLHNAVENPILISRERDAWITYTLVAFDVVRPHLISKYAQMRAGVLLRKTVAVPTTSNLVAYERFMSNYILDFNTRATSLGVSLRSAEGGGGTPRMWCFVHNRAGHMYPTSKARGYNPECWTCIADDIPRAPKDKLLSESHGFSDISAFKRISGDSITFVNESVGSSHRGDGSSSKAQRSQANMRDDDDDNE